MREQRMAFRLLQPVAWVAVSSERDGVHDLERVRVHLRNGPAGKVRMMRRVACGDAMDAANGKNGGGRRGCTRDRQTQKHGAVWQDAVGGNRR